MQKYKNQTLKTYLDSLASRNPVPGGGSAAALAAALGAALISMVAQYSIGKGKSKAIEDKIKNILKESEKIRKRLLELVDLDAQAYLGVVKAKRANEKTKKKAAQWAREVPFEVGQLCYRAVSLTPYLVKEGNRYLISDIKVANELLMAAFASAMVNVEINQ